MCGVRVQSVRNLRSGNLCDTGYVCVAAVRHRLLAPGCPVLGVAVEFWLSHPAVWLRLTRLPPGDDGALRSPMPRCAARVDRSQWWPRLSLPLPRLLAWYVCVRACLSSPHPVWVPTLCGSSLAQMLLPLHLLLPFKTWMSSVCSHDASTKCEALDAHSKSVVGAQMASNDIKSVLDEVVGLRTDYATRMVLG